MAHSNPLDEKVDIRRLLAKIDFVEEDYRNANLEQPKLLYGVVRYRVQKMRSRVQAEMSLKQIRASRSYRLRKTGKYKTEGAIKDKLDQDESFIRAEKKMNEASFDEELAKQLVEVFKQRGGAIQNIIKANSNEIAGALWKLEHDGKSKKLQDASALLRGKFDKKYNKDSDEDT